MVAADGRGEQRGGYQLATDELVMAIGGFNAIPRRRSQFKAYG